MCAVTENIKMNKFGTITLIFKTHIFIISGWASQTRNTFDDKVIHDFQNICNILLPYNNLK